MNRLGPFTLVGDLPRGTSASLHRVRDPVGRRLVLKLHDPGQGEAGGLAELALLGVEHPGLACCLAAGRDPASGRLYTVTDEVVGVPLVAAALAARPCDPEALAADLLAALAVVHDAGLLHRDIKADNVLLERTSGRPVLIDFGLARPLADPGPLAGTPRCLAPELLTGQAASVASDLWALGLVLAEALLGRPLVSGEDGAALLAERSTPFDLPPEPLGTPRLAALLGDLLEPDPRRRPAEARQALAALGRTGDDRAALLGARSAALSRRHPRLTALRDELARGHAVADLLPGPDSSWSSARQVLLDLADEDDAVAEPPPATPEGLAGLARRLVAGGRLAVLLSPDEGRDEAERQRRQRLARALEELPGLVLRRLPPPAEADLRGLVQAWLGEQPGLVERLAPARSSWAELARATRELVQLGAVARQASSLVVDGDRLPLDWPAAAAPLPEDLPLAGRELIDLLALAGRPLARADLEACGAAGAGVLSGLADRGLVVALRSAEGSLWTLADGDLSRARAAAARPGASLRRSLAACLLPEAGGEPDEALAADLARVLIAPDDEGPPGEDDEATRQRLVGAASVLRRRAREGLAADLLERALAGSPAARPVLHRDLIDVLVRAGRRDRAREALARAQAACGEDPAWTVRRARLTALGGDARTAEELLSALDLDALEPEDAVLALQLRGGVLRQLGRLPESLSVLREALRRHGDGGDARAMVLLERVGLVEHELGRFDEAVRRFEEVADRARALGQDALLWSAVYNVGRSLREKGERRRGLALQEQAAELAEQAGNLVGLGTVLNSLGAGWLVLGRLDLARRHLSRALELARATEDRAKQAMVLNNSGHALALDGRLDEAEACWEESLSLRRDLGATRGQVAVLLVRAEQRLRRGRTDAAREDLDQLDDLLAGLDAPLQRREADLLGGLLAEALGDGSQAVERAGAVVARDGSRLDLRARALLARAARDDLADLDPEGAEAGPWLAEALAARAGLEGRDEVQALADLERALAQLGETPDGWTELAVLRRRLTLDLARLDRTLGEGDPDLALAGELVERASADLQRARGLAASHGTAADVRAVDDLATRLEAMDTADDGGGLTRLAGRMRALERLVEINQLLTVERDSQRLLDLIVDSAIELTGAARGFLILFEGQAEEFRAARNIDESTIRDPHFQISHSVARGVARSGEPLLTANALDDTRLTSAASISELNLLSILCVPMSHRGRVLGAVYLDHPQVVGRFGETHLEVATRLADQAAIAIQNARLSEHLEASNSELSARREEIARLNEALEDRLQQRERELAETRESLDRSRRALKLRYDYSSIVSRSPRMHEVFDLLDRVTDTDVPVVIHGESGTGKELLARAIHFNGPRSRADFLSINCAAIAEPLIESELFGSVKGAFTGADRDRKGLFAQADGGTLFLDEIGDMSLDVQKRLLRVLQEGEFLPVGGREVQRADVRILAATHRDLATLVEQGGFREDLYFRLAVAPVRLPPLRERPEDIALLLPHLLERHRGQARSVEPEALALLEGQRWPGNVRELENFVRKLLLFEPQAELLSGATVRRVLGLDEQAAAPSADGPAAATLKERLEAYERAQIREALDRNQGNKAATARELGVPVRSLYKMLERLGLSS